MKKTNLIGISGKKQSGKDLVAKIMRYLMVGADKALISLDKWNDEPVWGDILNKFHHSVWETKMFAGKVKEILCLLTGCTMEDLESEEFKASYMSEEWRVFSLEYHKQETKLFNTKKEAEYWALKQYSSKCKKFIREIIPTYRQALQWIGTNLFRDKFHPNTWVNALFADYGIKDLEYFKAYPDNYALPNWIVTDVRFLNEIQAIKDREGIIIRINRYPKTIMNSRPGKIPKEISFDINKQFHSDLWKGECSRTHHSETKLDAYKNFDFVLNNSGSIEELIEKVREILIKIKLI